MLQKIKSVQYRIIALFCVIIMAVQALNISAFNNSVYASDIKGFLRTEYISEKNYKEDMDDVVIPYIDGIREIGYFTGEEDAEIYYEKYIIDDAKANVVISHGYTENLEKYNEIIYYLLKNSYNVFGIEHRGHGRSTRLGIKDKTQTHVESFDYYINDLKTFMDEVVVPSNEEDKPMFLFAHSMGGGISAGFLETYPEYFDRALLSAPMFEIQTGNVPSFLARLIAKCAAAIGKGGEYVFGMSSYSPSYDAESIGTSSLNRYEYTHSFVADNEELQNGGASFNWLNEALNATKEFVKEENASKVEIPVLLVQCGKDTYVGEKGQNKFAQYAKNCTIKYFADSRHEIYRETDNIQKAYLNNLFKFLNEGVSQDDSEA